MLNYLKEILFLLGEDRRKLPLIFCLFLVSSFLDLAGIGLIGPYVALVLEPGALDGFLDRFAIAAAVPRSQKYLLLVIGLLLLGVFFFKTIAVLVINYVIISFSEGIKVKLQTSLMHSYQHMQYTKFLRRNSSEYVYSINNLAEQFSGGIVASGLRTLSDGFLALAILALLAWQDFETLVILLSFLLLGVYGFDRFCRHRLCEYGRGANLAAGVVVQGINEAIDGLKEIRIIGKEAFFQRMVVSGAKQYARYVIRNRIVSMMPRYIMELLMVTFVVSIVAVNLLLNNELKIIIPTLAMFGMAGLRLVPSTNTITASLANFRYSRDSVSRLYSDLSSVETTERGKQTLVASEKGEDFRLLKMEKLYFCYPGAAKPALKSVSLEIRRGECIGLVGSSGSGKTTLVDVLLGLFEHQEGNIHYNDRPLGEVLAVWRSQVAYLPQQVFLIDNTLRRNIAMGVEEGEIDDSKLDESLRQARLADLVEQLPKGVETLIGERGVRLSGGQRQRVALARAFYHGRSVLVMDESTSALDNETEREIVEEIQRLKGQKTMIVIAHRLSTVQHCDRIYRLAEGRIIQSGTPEEML